MSHLPHACWTLQLLLDTLLVVLEKQVSMVESALIEHNMTPLKEEGE